jgi:hypothetical protein
MTNIFPSLFEDDHLKVFTNCILKLPKAATLAEIDTLVQESAAALNSVKNSKIKEKALQQLRALEKVEKDRINKTG